MPPKAGLATLDHLIRLLALFLIPKVLANLKSMKLRIVERKIAVSYTHLTLPTI